MLTFGRRGRAGFFRPNVAQATAARPLTRPTAEKVLADIILRAKTVNRQKMFAYRVEKLVVFGSYVKGQARLNDADVGVRLTRAGTGDAQRHAEQRRRAARGADFRNISHWAIWPKLEVLRFLRSRSRDGRFRR
jgi:hypothetical protein